MHISALFWVKSGDICKGVPFTKIGGTSPVPYGYAHAARHLHSMIPICNKSAIFSNTKSFQHFPEGQLPPPPWPCLRATMTEPTCGWSFAHHALLGYYYVKKTQDRIAKSSLTDSPMTLTFIQKSEKVYPRTLDERGREKLRFLAVKPQ